MSSHLSHTTTNHDEIRRWAESRGARPACVKGTGGNGDPGMIRLDFPGYSGADSLQHISWDEWFEAFDANNLALVYQDKTAEGERSNFNKLIARDTAERRESGDSHASRHDGSSKTSSHGSSRSSHRETAGQSASDSSDSSLQEREYRDSHGEVHHHTRTYMEEHRGEDDSKR